MRWLRLAFLPLMLAAQETPFGVQSRLVLVPTTVTDSKGRTIEGLEPKDFTIFDNGRAQPIGVDTIATGVAPIALVVAVQAAGISEPVLDKLRKVGAMIQPLITGERGCAGVVSFSERIDWVQECTGNVDLIAQAFHRIKPGAPKGARMLDAVNSAVSHLTLRPNSRRVLLLISETRDRGSESTLEEVTNRAQALGVTVYAATYSAFKTAFTTRSSPKNREEPKRPKTPSEETGTHTGAPPACNPNGCPDFPLPPREQRADILGALGELKRLGSVKSTEVLALQTGGAEFPFTRLKGLEEAIQKLGGELHSQYLLSFVPSDRTAGVHSIEVRVARAGARVRSRPSYWATGQ
ncbi:MAG: VWA domain-containing protein [Bryobacteraceae bacterium]